jgi:hypothetical protein
MVVITAVTALIDIPVGAAGMIRGGAEPVWSTIVTAVQAGITSRVVPRPRFILLTAEMVTLVDSPVEWSSAAASATRS